MLHFRRHISANPVEESSTRSSHGVIRATAVVLAMAAYVLAGMGSARALAEAGKVGEARGGSQIKAKFLGAQKPGAAEASQRGDEQGGPGEEHAKPNQVATPTQLNVAFATAMVTTATPQTLDATFAISGYTGSFTPTAAMHYGHDYTIGTVSCTPTSSTSENCSFPITFSPTLPGTRRDAIVVSDGTTTLSTVLVYGVGTAPFAAFAPGITTRSPSQAYYIYNSTVDENDTIYFVTGGDNLVYSYTSAGVLTQLPITGLQGPDGIAVDGAGTLYITQNTYSHTLTTYTVDGVQGTITLQYPGGGSFNYVVAVAVDGAGDVYTLDIENNDVYEFVADGSYVVTLLDPAITGAGQLAVDDAGNVFVSGYTINEIPVGGTQSQINSNGAGDGLAIDASEQLYATRYGSGGVAGLLPSDYQTGTLVWDGSTSPLGLGLGSDGTLAVGYYNNLDVVTRNQGLLAFGEQETGVTSTAQGEYIQNIGNEPMTISKIAITGSGFALVTTGTGQCSKGQVLQPSEYCQVTVTLTPTHAGNFTGTLTLTTNSLYNTNSTSVISMTGFVYGPYIVVKPTTVAFGNQVEDTTSAAKTVTLTNDGLLYSAGFGAPTSSDPAFTPSLGTCTAYLSPGDTCQMSVTFTPTAVQSYSATITGAYSSTGGGPNLQFTFDVTGAGVPPAVPQAVLNPTSLAFGGQLVGTPSSAQTIQLSNPGNAALAISGITLTGAQAGNFGQTNTCGSSLAAGANCTISVTFTPSSAYYFDATLSVADDAANTPQTATLTGFGTAAQLQFVPTLFDLFAATGMVGDPCGDAGYPGPAIDATLCTAMAVAQDQSGNVYIVDTLNNTVREVTPDGTIQAFAGVPLESSAGAGYGGDNGPASEALLSVPSDVAVDASGNVYIADYSNCRVRKVDAVTQIMTTVAGIGCGNFFRTGVATEVNIPEPIGLAFDPTGNMYIATASQDIVVKVDTSGNATVFAGEQSDTGEGIPGYSGDNGPATSAELDTPYGLATDAAGDVYIADSVNNVIRMVNTSGVITTVAGNYVLGLGYSGDGGPATSAQISAVGVATDLAGDLYISSGNTNVGVVRKVDTSGTISTYVGGNGTAAPGGGPAEPISLDGAFYSRIDSNGDVIVPTTNREYGAAQVFEAGPQGILQFGNQGQSTTSAAMAVTLVNTGNSPLTLTGYTVVGDFAVASGGTCTLPSEVAKRGRHPNKVTSHVIAAGATCTVNVTFTPLTIGALTGTLTFTSNSVNTPNVVQLSGTGVTPMAPQAVLSPTSVVFPNTNVGTTSAAMTVTLSNPGNATLTITGVTIGGTNPSDFAQTNNCGTSLAAGDNCTISVTFTPASATSFSATLSVADNAAGSPQTASLSGTGAAPQAVLSPTSVVFPNTNVGTTSAAMTVTLSNPGNATLTITGVTIGGTNPSDFAQTNNCGGSVAAGGSCTISVTFTPASATSFSATLSVADNAANSPQVATLSGTGAAPQGVLSPTSVVFPNTNVGATSAAMTVTLSNPGNATLTISGVTIGGTNPSDFAQTNNCGTTLAAGGSCAISVTFTPASATSFSATLSVADNAANSPQTASLSGTGVTPMAPEAVLSPTSLSFPNTTVGITSAVKTVTLSNPGNAALTISGVSITGASPSDFAQTNNCGGSLAAGANCTISVTFTPASAASFSAAVSVSDNATGSPQSATLAGTGTVAPSFTVTSTTPSQTVEPGGAAKYSIVVTPSAGGFDSAVTLSATGLPSGATATFVPASVTPGDAPATSVLTIQTAVAQTSEGQTAARGRKSGSPWHYAPMALPALLLLIPGRRKLLSTPLRRVLVIVLALGMFGLSGCGGGGFPLGSPTKTYTITVTGTSGTETSSATVTLILQQ